MGILLSSINDLKLRSRIETQLGRAEQSMAPKRVTASPAEETESEIHDQIIGYCRSNGLPYIHSRMDRKSTVAVGAPDFCIAFRHGITLWVECKRPGGKLTPKQQGFINQLRMHGHMAEVVYCYGDFLKCASAMTMISMAEEMKDEN